MKTAIASPLPSAVIAAFLSVTALFLLSACDKAPAVATAPAVAPAVSVGTTIDDSVVTSKVKSALLADPDVKSFDLKVETRSGEVMLSGFVGNQAQVDRAIAVAKGVEGVKVVSNKMDLKEGTASVGNEVDDGLVTTKIKSALLADPGIKSFDIAVVTRKGEAQLSGFVDSQAQIDKATALAMAVPGVTSVANGMSVKK
jgi:hyperosmotically inducible protein